jgi:hypothetical protein
MINNKRGSNKLKDREGKNKGREEEKIKEKKSN